MRCWLEPKFHDGQEPSGHDSKQNYEADEGGCRPVWLFLLPLGQL